MILMGLHLPKVYALTARIEEVQKILKEELTDAEKLKKIEDLLNSKLIIHSIKW